MLKRIFAVVMALVILSVTGISCFAEDGSDVMMTLSASPESEASVSADADDAVVLSGVEKNSDDAVLATGVAVGSEIDDAVEETPSANDAAESYYDEEENEAAEALDNLQVNESDDAYTVSLSDEYVEETAKNTGRIYAFVFFGLLIALSAVILIVNIKNSDIKPPKARPKTVHTPSNAKKRRLNAQAGSEIERSR